MKKNIYWPLILLALLSVANHCLGRGDESLAYANIPKDLLKNANAVVRYHDEFVRVLSPSEVEYTNEIAITILNDKGYNYAKFHDYYDKYDKITSIEGVLYDKDGNQVRKLKKSGIKDWAMLDGYSLYNDDRVKSFDFNYSVYPFTVVYTVEEKNSSTLFLPEWYPQPGKDCAVQNAAFTVTYLPEIPLRFKTFHIPNKPVATDENGVKKLVFSISDIKAVKKDDLEPNGRFSRPIALLAIDKFALDGYKGTMNTWQAYGKFFYDLNANRDVLPANVKAIVHKLTDTCKTEQEKIAFLYQYLKDNTRYVSIQLGIGGWQCFDAESVADNGYGDCKALSNYMMSLLKEAGITSYVALIKGDFDFSKDDALQSDFPGSYFNHVILCVPSAKDTTWLECTAKTLPPGYLSAFTADRDALIIMPDGGHIVHTPVYGCRQNEICKNITAHINADNKIQAQALIKYTGEVCDAEYHQVINQSKEDVDNYMNRKFDLPDYSVKKYNVEHTVNNNLPEINEDISLTGTAQVSRSGSRVFITPNISNVVMYEATPEPDRTSPFELKHSFEVCDTETIIIDGAYNPEYMPDSVNMSYPFGSYTYKMSFEHDSTLKVVCCYKQQAGIYPATEYNDFAALSKAVNFEMDKKQVVLLKKQ